MSEFGSSDAKAWLQMAIKKNCTIQQAIYYSLYFECQRDDKKFTRAWEFFCHEYQLEVVK